MSGYNPDRGKVASPVRTACRLGAMVGASPLLPETPVDVESRQSSNEENCVFAQLRISERIETCRAHTATLEDLATVASRALDDCFDYDTDEPHLGKCIDVVGQLLQQVLAALPALGIVSHDTDAQARAIEVAAGCEAQRQLLLRAQHITTAAVYILRSTGLDRSTENDDIVTSLHVLAHGIRAVFDGLDPMVLAWLAPPRN